MISIMAYPNSTVCTQCHVVFSREAWGGIDVSELFNLSPELAWVCSQECEKKVKLKNKEGTWMK